MFLEKSLEVQKHNVAVDYSKIFKKRASKHAGNDIIPELEQFKTAIKSNINPEYKFNPNLVEVKAPRKFKFFGPRKLEVRVKGEHYADRSHWAFTIAERQKGRLNQNLKKGKVNAKTLMELTQKTLPALNDFMAEEIPKIERKIRLKNL